MAHLSFDGRPIRLRDTGETVGVHDIRKKRRLADLRRSKSRQSSFQVIPARRAETDQIRWPHQVQQLGCAPRTNRPASAASVLPRMPSCLGVSHRPMRSGHPADIRRIQPSEVDRKRPKNSQRVGICEHLSNRCICTRIELHGCRVDLRPRHATSSRPGSSSYLTIHRDRARGLKPLVVPTKIRRGIRIRPGKPANFGSLGRTP